MSGEELGNRILDARQKRSELAAELMATEGVLRYLRRYRAERVLANMNIQRNDFVVFGCHHKISAIFLGVDDGGIVLRRMGARRPYKTIMRLPYDDAPQIQKQSQP